MKTKKIKAKSPFCTEYKMSDKDSIKICKSVLEQLWNQANNAEQTPQLVIGLRRNEKEVFMLTANLTIEKQKKL